MDISTTTAPRSDQQNFDDYGAGPKTVTITEVRAGSDEQPVEIHLVEFPGRPYKPSKSMRRVLLAAWGAETTPYVGRRMTLAGDPTVKFGGTTVGGIKIVALSNIDKRLTLALTVTKGKRAPHIVDPLPDAPKPPPEPTAEEVAACVDQRKLREWYGISSPDRQAQILARKADLENEPTPNELPIGGGES